MGSTGPLPMHEYSSGSWALLTRGWYFGGWCPICIIFSITNITQHL